MAVFVVSMLISMLVAEAPGSGRHVADDVLMRPVSAHDLVAHA